MARVTAALGDSRVVTTTGVGGVGKTRLAIQVAADLLPRHPQGVWLVELAPVTEQAGVAEAVAQIFHPTNRSGQSFEDGLVEILFAENIAGGVCATTATHARALEARVVSGDTAKSRAGRGGPWPRWWIGD